jgi:4-aminobutyrate aminotransferase-like enzyme
MAQFRRNFAGQAATRATIRATTVLAAVAAQAERGITTMLPTEDSIWVAEELARRFAVQRWLFTLSATDANRTALRIARRPTPGWSGISTCTR